MQSIMRTTKEDTEALDRARKRIKIGDVVLYQDKKLKKIKNDWEEVDNKAYAKLVIIQV